MTKTTLEIIRNTYPEVRYVEYNDKVWYSQDEVDKICDKIINSDILCKRDNAVKQERERIINIIRKEYNSYTSSVAIPLAFEYLIKTIKRDKSEVKKWKHIRKVEKR